MRNKVVIHPDTPEEVALALQSYGVMSLEPLARSTDNNARVYGELALNFVKKHHSEVKRVISTCTIEYGYPCFNMVAKRFQEPFRRYVEELRPSLLDR